MRAKTRPHLRIDIQRGVVHVDGKRLSNLICDTRPWRALVALARATDRRLRPEALFPLFPTGESADPKAAVCDAFRRLRETLTKDGVDIKRLIRRDGHGPWELVARVTIRGAHLEISSANSAANGSAVSQDRD